MAECVEGETECDCDLATLRPGKWTAEVEKAHVR